jgi:MHS family alpha-ketoglutarate permease-like MFS transporter
MKKQKHRDDRPKSDVLALFTQYPKQAFNAVVKAELFPAHIRALGVALPYAIANPLFSGTAELVALSFKNAGHENYYFFYITFMIGLSLIIYFFMKDTQKYSMTTDD